MQIIIIKLNYTLFDVLNFVLVLTFWDKNINIRHLYVGILKENEILINIFVPGIFLPTRGGFFMWSDSGVWEICRYIFQPFENQLRYNATYMATPNPFDIGDLKGEYFTSKFINFIEIHYKK